MHLPLFNIWLIYIYNSTHQCTFVVLNITSDKLVHNIGTGVDVFNIGTGIEVPSIGTGV